jgi:hypothetical protein
VVTGFQSGVYNPVSGWHLIRASDAHSWVEAFLAGRGWTTFDPTPPGERAPTASIWARLMFYADAAETFWQEWVLSYDLERQITLASLMEQSGRKFRMNWFEAAGAWFAFARRTAAEFYNSHRYALGGVAVAAALWWFAAPRVRRLARVWRGALRVRRGEAHAADATLLYERMLKVLNRRGYRKPGWLTPAEFARVIPISAQSVLVEEFTSAYNEMRFGGRAGAAARMVKLIEQLERLKT